MPGKSGSQSNLDWIRRPHGTSRQQNNNKSEDRTSIETMKNARHGQFLLCQDVPQPQIPCRDTKFCSLPRHKILPIRSENRHYIKYIFVSIFVHVLQITPPKTLPTSH